MSDYLPSFDDRTWNNIPFQPRDGMRVFAISPSRYGTLVSVFGTRWKIIYSKVKFDESAPFGWDIDTWKYFTPCDGSVQ